MPYDGNTSVHTREITSHANRRSKTLLVADLFCGAGGSSTGARRALSNLGYDMDLVAVNHWRTAIATHTRNHTSARHYNINLDAARPMDLVPEGRLDLLMASPECTFFSRARGGRPMNDQSRMSAWHVHRWCTELRVKRLMIENVPEFERWGPLHPVTKRPVKSREGEYFRGFLSALEAIGYKADYRMLDAADYGDATNRKRLFVIARADGKRLRWPEPSHSRNPCADLFGANLQPWKTAREVIDRTIPSRSVLYGAKKYSPKTIARIKAGLRRYNPMIAAAFEQAIDLRYEGAAPPPVKVDTAPTAEPFLVMLYGSNTARSIDRPVPTVTAGGNHIGLCEPHIERLYLAEHEGMIPSDGRTSKERQMDNTASSGGYLPQPFLVPQFGEREGQAPRTHSIDAPLPAVTGHGAGALVEPFLMHITHAGGDRVRGMDLPLPTITGANRGELGFVEPVIMDIAGGKFVLDLRFRMLEPDELAEAMGFHDEERAYEFTGNKTEVIKQIGNAVSCGVASALTSALCQD